MEFSNRFVSECREISTYLKHVQAPVFRKSFRIEKGERRGELLVCGLGFYNLFVNGREITKGYLAPYISNSDHLIYYDEYDITSYLTEGENVIGIMLGDGFQNGKTIVWDFAENAFNSAPKLAVSVRIENNGAVWEFNGMDFKCKKGPVLFNDLRSGVFFDRRLEEKGWNRPGFTEDGGWHVPVPAEKPRGKAKLCEAEPVVVTRELKPVKIYKGRLADYEPRGDVKEGLLGQEPQEPGPGREGGYIYDFGENNAGIFRLRIKGHPGQRVDIQCGEMLKDGMLDYSNINFYPDGYAQRDIYILGSEEEEVFEPMFTFHGFRYLYVSGIREEQAVPELLTYLVMSSGLEERGTFTCSDETANAIYRMGRRSDLSNFYYFPLDCPHREKNGWTGDAQASAEHMIMTIGAEKSWREWLHNIRCAQTGEGALPGIVPTGTWGYDWGNGPAWDRVLFELPYMIYRYRGETEVIRENAHAMLAYLEYISGKRDRKGIVAIGLGDWVPVDRDVADYQVPLGFSDSVMVYCMCREAETMFEAVGLGLHAGFARQLGSEIRDAVRKQYIHLDSMLVKSACQSAQAMGIYYDIFDTGEKPEAFRRLMEILHRDGEKFTCGFLGLRVLFHVLSDFGESELAYRMITDKTYPSYGYFAERGDTTLPEQMLPDRERRKLSQNHHFLGDVVQWYMKYPGGIHVENSARVSVRPRFISSLQYVKASHRLPAGEVRTAWRREEDRIYLEVECPGEVACEVELENGYVFEENGKCYLENGRGSYRIRRTQRQ